MEAANVLEDVLGGVSQKRIKQAAVPGVSVTFISRAKHGDVGNPLFRLAALFLTMKRLGMTRKQALQLLDWLRAVIDWAFPPDEEAAELEKAIEADARADVADDVPRLMARLGSVEAKREYLEASREIVASKTVVIRALEVELRRA